MRVDVNVLDVALNKPQRQLVAWHGNRVDNLVMLASYLGIPVLLFQYVKNQSRGGWEHNMDTLISMLG